MSKNDRKLLAIVVVYFVIWMLTTAWRLQRPLGGDSYQKTFDTAYFAGMAWPLYWSYQVAEWITKPEEAK
jgi:hypothetical protein